MEDELWLQNAVLIDPDRGGPAPGGLVVAGGRILRQLGPDTRPPPAARVHDCGGRHVAPGLVDLHVHGTLVLDRDAAGALFGESASQARHGVTSFLPTTVAWDRGALTERVAAMADTLARSDWPGARPLGLHLEGPWIRAEAAGAQPREAIRPYDPVEGREVLAAAAGTLRMVTFAPEVAGADRLLGDLTEEGTVASVGHTLASEADLARAVRAGARHATHLFNAMGPLHHRGPGVAAWCLAEDRLSCDLIADGAHVHPAWIRIAARVKGPGLCLISDRVGPAPAAERGGPAGDESGGSRARSPRDDDAPAARHDAGPGPRTPPRHNAPPGASAPPRHEAPGCCGGTVGASGGSRGFGSGELTSDGTAWRLADGRLAGSRLTLDLAVANMTRWAACDLLGSVRAATLAPARVLGLEDEIGTLRPGARADLVLLDGHGRVAETWVAGRRVHPA